MTTHTQHRDRGLDTTAIVTPTGAFVDLDGEPMYVIRDFDRMPSFLMSIVSDSDHWMYVSTGGALAAGRIDADHSLFPYETDDRLFRAGGATGPRTVLRVLRDGDPDVLWEPLTDKTRPKSARRNVYKSVLGNCVVFEEVRDDLGLTFRYEWATSADFGFVRTATLMRHSSSRPARVEVLDGLLNLVPANVPLGLQQSSSTLVEAYRRNEIDTATGLAIFSLEARITDRAEPAESMHANIVWSLGLPNPRVTLTSESIRAFRAGREWDPRTLVRGSRGHYLLSAAVDLRELESASWSIIADVHQSHHQIERRRAELLAGSITEADITDHVQAGTGRLRSLIGAADGLQSTGDRLATTHHYANTLFNSMRGGVFVDNGAVPVDDFVRFLEARNRAVYRTHAAWLASLSERIDHRALVARAANAATPTSNGSATSTCPSPSAGGTATRAGPGTVSPSGCDDAEGEPDARLPGQLARHLPELGGAVLQLPRLLREHRRQVRQRLDGRRLQSVPRHAERHRLGGTRDPDDPWSNIGYWGDHQIVYLLRLLEASQRVPPRRAPRAARTARSSATPTSPTGSGPTTRSSATASHHRLRRRPAPGRSKSGSAFIGSDGKLCSTADDDVLHVDLAEKLLVPALSKLSNLVVDGGIWMNTQRPEWNDANNALVGYGVSMVTLSYLRRYLEFCERLVGRESDQRPRRVGRGRRLVGPDGVGVPRRVSRSACDEPTVSDRRRKRMLDALGTRLLRLSGPCTNRDSPASRP